MMEERKEKKKEDGWMEILLIVTGSSKLVLGVPAEEVREVPKQLGLLSTPKAGSVEC